MNGIECPNCNLVNMSSATECHRCLTSLTEPLKTKEINYQETINANAPVIETFEDQTMATQRLPQSVPQNQSVKSQNQTIQSSEVGRQTHFWYKFYLIVMTLFYLGVVVFGGISLYFSSEEVLPEDAQDMFVTGIAFLLVGITLAIFYVIGIFLPRTSWTWILGNVYIAIGLTTCCFLPISIPLLVFWIKPETQAYFGRK